MRFMAYIKLVQFVINFNITGNYHKDGSITLTLPVAMVRVLRMDSVPWLQNRLLLMVPA